MLRDAGSLNAEYDVCLLDLPPVTDLDADPVRPLSLVLLRKEVIQPHLPIRLPCYDFIPLTKHTFGTSPPCGLGQ
jgi:hypothetical protein